MLNCKPNVTCVHAGATLPGNVNNVPNPPGYFKFAGIELTLKYDWVDCPDDPPFGPVALGQTPSVGYMASLPLLKRYCHSRCVS